MLLTVNQKKRKMESGNWTSINKKLPTLLFIFLLRSLFILTHAQVQRDLRPSFSRCVICTWHVYAHLIHQHKYRTAWLVGLLERERKEKGGKMFAIYHCCCGMAPFCKWHSTAEESIFVSCVVCRALDICISRVQLSFDVKWLKTIGILFCVFRHLCVCIGRGYFSWHRRRCLIAPANQYPLLYIHVQYTYRRGDWLWLAFIPF